MRDSQDALKSPISTVLAMLLCLPLCGCSWLRGDYKGWTKFSGPGFSVMVPRAPNGSDEHVYRVPGAQDIFQIKHNGDLYQVSHSLTIRPRDEHELEQALDAWRNAYVSNLENAQYVSERKVSLSGHTGRELKLKIQGRRETTRCYLAASASQLICISATTDGSAKDAGLFLDSLVIEEQ